MSVPESRGAARERVCLHTALYGGSARSTFWLTVLALAVAVPAVLVNLLRHHGDGAWFLLMLPLFGSIIYVQLRERPEIYGTLQGLDLEWAWGKKRHLAWREIRSIECNSLVNVHARRFRLRLARGSLDLFARKDFLAVIDELKRASNAE